MQGIEGEMGRRRMAPGYQQRGDSRAKAHFSDWHHQQSNPSKISRNGEFFGHGDSQRGVRECGKVAGKTCSGSGRREFRRGNCVRIDESGSIGFDFCAQRRALHAVGPVRGADPILVCSPGEASAQDPGWDRPAVRRGNQTAKRSSSSTRAAVVALG